MVQYSHTQTHIHTHTNTKTYGRIHMHKYADGKRLTMDNKTGTENEKYDEIAEKEKTKNGQFHRILLR